MEERAEPFRPGVAHDDARLPDTRPKTELARGDGRSAAGRKAQLGAVAKWLAAVEGANFDQQVERMLFGARGIAAEFHGNGRGDLARGRGVEEERAHPQRDVGRVGDKAEGLDRRWQRLARTIGRAGDIAVGSSDGEPLAPNADLQLPLARLTGRRLEPDEVVGRRLDHRVMQERRCVVGDRAAAAGGRRDVVRAGRFGVALDEGR